jgi:hypothetical protein
VQPMSYANHMLLAHGAEWRLPLQRMWVPCNEGHRATARRTAHQFRVHFRVQSAQGSCNSYRYARDAYCMCTPIA